MANKNEELAAKGSNTLAGLEAFSNLATEGQILGFEALDASDIKMPKIRLLQPMSDEVATGKGKPGQFYNSVTGTASDAIDCVFLLIGKSRIAWKQPFKRGEEPLCRSFDGEVSANGELCKNCPKAKWGADNKRPECNLSYTWLGAVANDGSYQAFRMIAAGTSFAPTRDFIQKVMNILRSGKKSYPLYILKVCLTSKLERGDSGNYYVLQYGLKPGADGKGFETITMDDAVALQEMQENLKGLFDDLNRRDIDNGTDAPEEAGSSNGSGALF